MSVLRAVFNYDPSGLRAVGALPRLLGVALSAVGGEAVGGHGAAVLAGVGALYAGIASFGGVHRARLRRMLAAIFAASMATWLGSLVQPNDLLVILTTFAVSFGLGVFAAAGPDAAQVALLGTGTLVVFAGLPGAASHPLQNALLVFGGGFGQVVILSAVQPFSPLAAERRAVASVYAGLARFAHECARGQKDAPVSDAGALVAARDLLRDGFGYGGSPELGALWVELELADALRANLAGLDRCGAPRPVWSALAVWFERGAAAIARGRPVDRSSPFQESSEPCQPWLTRIERTLGATGIGGIAPVVPRPRSWLAALRDVGTFREVVFGHALRYAVALTFATAAYRLLGSGHGYWAPLALAFSLRADFAGTLARGLGRIVGTILGVAVATALVAWGHPGPLGLTLAMLAAAYASFALLGASFVAYSAALAFYVVVSVVLAGASATAVAEERIVATAAGSLLALVTVLVWPRWEAQRVRTVLAVAFAAQAEYADAVREFGDPQAVTHARVQARTARLEAERVVESASFEPAWSRAGRLDGAGAALARLAENAARLLAAHVAALDPHEDDRPEDLDRLAAEDRSMAADLMG